MSRNKTSKARTSRAAVASQTLQILSQGHYRTDAGPVWIEADLRQAIAGTRTIGPGGGIHIPTATHQTTFAVRNETTLVGARRLVAAGHDVAVLNFASAKNPGGGFQGGSQAQEESLARSSGLFLCLKGSEMYAINRRLRLPLYSDHMIYSPGVPVFRDDDGELLPRHWCCAIISAPAVNYSVARKRRRPHHIEAAMRGRIERILSVMAEHGHDTIVLGAWGCGVFRNDPDDVAGYFLDSLTGAFAGVFARVVFSIPDKPRGRFILPFEKRFG